MTTKSKRRLYRPTKREQQHSEAPASPRGRRRHPEHFNPGLRLAVEAAGGSMSHLARLLDITPAAIAQWDKIPLKRVLDVERVTKVDREQLRPDFYRRRGSKQ